MLILAALLLLAVAPQAVEATAHDLIDEVAGLVREHFYDPQLRGVDWQSLVAEAHFGVEGGTAVDAAIDALLAALGTSHTARYTADDPAYYQLAAIFAEPLRARFGDAMHARFGDAAITYVGVGWFTETIGGKVFVSGLLEGFPAARGGLLVGDEIVAVGEGPYRGTGSFSGRAKRLTRVRVRRRPAAEPIAVDVIPRRIDAGGMFLEAMRQGARVLEHEGRKIGYLRPWSYAGAQYQELLEALIGPGGELSDADALVLDLRGGWGGADPVYLRPFLPGIPTLTMIDRSGHRSVYGPQWRKPLVVLADGGTRSGKEVLVWGVRQAALGTVVGMRTAGAVVAGRAFLLTDGSLLYLAVADIRVDGERLEGRGVAPHIEVPMRLPYAAGEDPQLERALAEAATAADREQRRLTADESRSSR